MATRGVAVGASDGGTGRRLGLGGGSGGAGGGGDAGVAGRRLGRWRLGQWWRFRWRGSGGDGG